MKNMLKDIVKDIVVAAHGKDPTKGYIVIVVDPVLETASVGSTIQSAELTSQIMRVEAEHFAKHAHYDIPPSPSTDRSSN
jgi:hypothetical protein